MEALMGDYRFDTLMADDRFIDIGIPEDYSHAQTQLAGLRS
jgi:hypothetical protein